MNGGIMNLNENAINKKDSLNSTNLSNRKSTILGTTSNNSYSKRYSPY